MKGKYVIVRADRAGVFFGKLKERKGTEVTLTEVRKLHYWDGAAAIEEISAIGSRKPNDCRFTITVPEMEITGVCQVIPCQDKAIEVIKSVREWKA